MQKGQPVVRRTIVFTALALFAAGAAQAQPVTSERLDPPPGEDGGYDRAPPAPQTYGAPTYGTPQGYPAPADEVEPGNDPYADPAAGGTYDPTTGSTRGPTPLTGPRGTPSYAPAPSQGRGAPPPAYDEGAPPAYGRTAPPDHGRPAPGPYGAAPVSPGEQAGVSSACDDIAEELRRFRGSAANPMQARDEACVASRNASSAFRQCSDLFFQQYEEKRDEYRRCMERQADAGEQRLDDRRTTADAARDGYGGTAPQMAGPYARSGSPGWLGVQIAPVTPQAAYRTGAEGVQGAYVLNAVMNSPAQRAGLRRGDIIVGFDGEAIDSPKDLQYQAERLSAGQQVRLDILRAGRRETLEVEITPRP
ncbi:MAG: PDZ domain-containing protein [Sphingomonadales bacterium]